MDKQTNDVPVTAADRDADAAFIRAICDVAIANDGTRLSAITAREVKASLSRLTSQPAPGDLAKAYREPSAIAAPARETDPDFECDEDGNPLWRCEIQCHGGHATVAEVFGATEAEANARGQAIAAALSAQQEQDIPARDSALLDNSSSDCTFPVRQGGAVAVSLLCKVRSHRKGSPDPEHEAQLDHEIDAFLATASLTPTAPQPDRDSVLRPFVELADCYDPSEDDSHECWMDAGPIVVFPEARKAFTLGAVRKIAALATTEPQSDRDSVLEEAIRELVEAFEPFAKVHYTDDEDGGRKPFIDSVMHDSDGIDLSWEPDLPFAPLVVGQFRRADAAYSKAIALQQSPTKEGEGERLLAEARDVAEPVIIPAEVFDFLMGRGPLRGCHFGEKPEGERGNFWWRKDLARIDPHLSSTEATEEDGVQEAFQRGLDRAASMIQKRMEDRFAEHGVREPDTNACYYPGSSGEIYEALDEEADELIKAIETEADGVAL